MSSRALKKLASSNVKDAPLEEEDVGEEWAPKPKHSVFSMVELSESPENDPPLSAGESAQEDNAKQSPRSSKRNKKNKKRKKGSSKLKPDFDSTDDDIYLEAARQSYVIEKSPDLIASAGSSLNILDILSVNRKFLDYRAELQRKFGSSVVAGARARNSLPFGPLVRPKATWPLFVKCGLEMKQYEDADGVSLFAFTHDKDYSRQQRAFYALQNNIDPNAFSLILSKVPYHVDTLLHLSDYLMHQDSSEVAVDLLERALYSFQSAFHLAFTFSAGSCRMDYRVQENRSLFIALFRYTFYVASRGCYRAALEYSKALLLLDPANDPLAIVLSIDFFAISSEEYEFLISLYEVWNPTRNLYLLPNFAFSMPLVRWLQRNRTRKRKQTGQPMEPEAIDKMLQDALIMFPGFLPRLMKHVRMGGAKNLDNSVLFGKEVRLSESESLGRLLDLYVAQARYYWQESDVLAWLEANVAAVLGLVEPSVVDAADASVHQRSDEPDERLQRYSDKRKRLYTQPPRNIIRHIFLRELPEVPLLVPTALANQQIYSLDPFPPPDAVNTYDRESARHHQSNDSEDGIVGFLSALLYSLWPTTPSGEEGIAALNALLARLGLAVVVEEVGDDEEAQGGEEEAQAETPPPQEFD